MAKESREENCIICLMNNGMCLQDTAAILMDTMALGLLLKTTFFQVKEEDQGKHFKQLNTCTD